ncbi:MAG: hypothetical protein J1F16_00025 [Muribaculaceae bacterium]|nr:hypothetical protein [Muribaculaceae bacterium]
MRKILGNAIVASLLLYSAGAWADTGVMIYKTDGTSSFIPESDLDYIEFITTQPTDEELTNVIKNLKDGDSLEAVAVVTGISSRGLILTDNAGSILYYYGTNFNSAPYSIGTVVEAKGLINTYNDVLQLSSTAQLKVIGSKSYNYPMPTAIDGSYINAEIGNIEPRLATYVTLDCITFESGYALLGMIDGTTHAAYVYWPDSSILGSLEKGGVYTLTGYFLGISAIPASDNPVVNILVTNVEAKGAYDYYEFNLYDGRNNSVDFELRASSSSNGSIILNSPVFITYEGKVANPVLSSLNYGYLQVTPYTWTTNSIYTTTLENTFIFVDYCEVDGQRYSTPEGTFMIKDRDNGRYYAMIGTYNSFNVYASPTIEDGMISDNFLFSASMNDDNTWNIVNQYNNKPMYFSSKYNNFAGYSQANEGDYLPYIYSQKRSTR